MFTIPASTFWLRRQATCQTKKLVNIAHDYLQGMGFENNQYLIFRHYDAVHPHIHLLVNRITFDGEVVSDSNNYHRSEQLLREIEERYNLIQVEHNNFTGLNQPNIPSEDQGNQRSAIRNSDGSAYQHNRVAPSQLENLSAEQDIVVMNYQGTA